MVLDNFLPCKHVSSPCIAVRFRGTPLHPSKMQKTTAIVKLDIAALKNDVPYTVYLQELEQHDPNTWTPAWHIVFYGARDSRESQSWLKLQSDSGRHLQYKGTMLRAAGQPGR